MPVHRSRSPGGLVNSNPEVNFLIILLLLSDAPRLARHVYVRTRANDLLAFELAV